VYPTLGEQRSGILAASPTRLDPVARPNVACRGGFSSASSESAPRWAVPSENPLTNPVQASGDSSGQGAPVALLPLALLSGAALSLEVLLTKLLAYSVSAILIYVVLGIALLGFGAGGTLAAAYPRWTEREAPGDRLAWTSLAFSGTTLAAFAVFVRITPRLHELDLLTLAAAGLLTLPFLSAGLAVALALKVSSVGRTYGANLVGSAAGCLVPLTCLRAVGGERMIPLLAACGWVAALLFARRAKPSVALRSAMAGLGALVVAGVAFAVPLYSPLPEPGPLGQLAIVREHAARFGMTETKLYDRWNATGRIQIFGYDGAQAGPEPYPFLFYAQDSSAGSTLARWDGRRAGEPRSAGEGRSEIAHACSETLWSQAYFAPRKRVLVIGLGGGMDVQCALYNGASSVDVVEINPDSIAAVTGPFDDWVGGIGKNPSVRYHLGDGRSFAHRTQRGAYDVIQLSGVDTKNSASSGGLALSENTLYTTEAFVDYLRNLSDDGVLSIVRFSDAEAVRLARTAAAALARLGIGNPEAHVVVRDNTYVRGVLVRKKPLSEQDVATIERSLAPRDAASGFGVDIFFYSAMGMDFTAPPVIEHAPGRATPGPVSTYFAALREGREQAFLSAYPFDVSPTTDDRPFFFDVFRYQGLAMLGYPHVRGLAGVLGSVLVLALVLVLLPVVLSRFPVKAVPGAATAFFTAVGLAYLFVEVWLIHRFAMYLGHQAYSLAVVLGALLLSTGFGAAIGERVVAGPRARVVVGVSAIVVVLLLGKALLPAVLDATMSSGFTARVIVSVGYCAALGAFMGFPFPAGLSWARGRVPEAVPWYIGINGFASVVATLAVIPLSHALGYEAVMLTGGALYVAAVLASRAMRDAD
jgi:spermidine synthase